MHSPFYLISTWLQLLCVRVTLVVQGEELGSSCGKVVQWIHIVTVYTNTNVQAGLAAVAYAAHDSEHSSSCHKFAFLDRRCDRLEADEYVGVYFDRDNPTIHNITSKVHSA